MKLRLMMNMALRLIYMIQLLPSSYEHTKIVLIWYIGIKLLSFQELVSNIFFEERRLKSEYNTSSNSILVSRRRCGIFCYLRRKTMEDIVFKKISYWKISYWKISFFFFAFTTSLICLGGQFWHQIVIKFNINHH
jgi:hypothetical protein